MAKKETYFSQPIYKRIEVEIEGITPLIYERFSSPAKAGIDRNHTEGKKGKSDRPLKDPDKDFLESLYIIEKDKNGRPKVCGVKAIWFKAGMGFVAAEDKMRNTVYRNIRVGRTFDPNELLPVIPAVKGDPHLRIGEDGTRGDMVRNANGVVDLRFRGEMSAGWRVVVPIEFTASRVGEAQVLAWLDEAGRASGCGGWRPEKGGQAGMYRVVGKRTEKSTEKEQS